MVTCTVLLILRRIGDYAYVQIQGVSICRNLGWPAGWPHLRLGARIPDDIVYD